MYVTDLRQLLEDIWGILTAVGIVQAEGNTNNSIYRFVAN